MAGTEDYSFYCSIENSPFWIKKADETITSSPDKHTNECIQQWEKKLVSPPKYSHGLCSVHSVAGAQLIVTFFLFCRWLGGSESPQSRSQHDEAGCGESTLSPFPGFASTVPSIPILESWSCDSSTSCIQVNVFSRKYHTVPFTLIPVVIRLHQRQSLTVLWKGIGSALIVKGLTLAVEDVVSKITPWPKYKSFCSGRPIEILSLFFSSLQGDWQEQFFEGYWTSSPP